MPSPQSQFSGGVRPPDETNHFSKGGTTMNRNRKIVEVSAIGILALVLSTGGAA